MYTGTPVHYEQTVREEDAESIYGYTGTLCAYSRHTCGFCSLHQFVTCSEPPYAPLYPP